LTDVFIVPHTHWDPEWYLQALRFKQRLIPVVDELLDALEADPALRCFLLDGQLAIVEDYLSVRPDQRDRVATLAAADRILLGPWYVLADELLSTDEVLVRNLLVGRSQGLRLGGWLSLGYSPDAFGHPAALPTILKGFGIDRAIVWRGYGGEPGQEKDIFHWVAPDASRVLVHHLPPAGYEVGAELPAASSELTARWRSLRGELERRASSPAWLLLSGADHHALQADLSDVVARLQSLDPACSFRIASPLDYFDALPSDIDACTVHGELRFSYRYTWTLQGVHATRSRLKRIIAEGERLLTRWAEPQCALAWATGSHDRRPLLAASWQRHLRSCAHDSFGGCTTDEVARDVAHRAAGCAAEARSLFADALLDRMGQDRHHARRHPKKWQPTLMAVNPSPSKRSGILEATLAYFDAHMTVGRPGLSRRDSTRSVPPNPTLLTSDGRRVPVQVLQHYPGYDRLDSDRDYPDQDVVSCVRIAVAVRDVPGLGVIGLSVSEGKDPPQVRRSVAADGSGAQSEWCCVTEDEAGGFCISDPEGGTILHGVADIVSERDDGDAYTFQPASDDAPAKARWGRLQPVWNGPLVAAVAREFSVDDRVSGTVYARLDAGSRLVRIIVEGANHHGNQRLRVTFAAPAGHRGNTVADMQFGPVFRKRESFDVAEFPNEWPVTTAPMHRYVSLPTGGGRGLSVFGRGVFEYELTPGDELAVTLFRAVSELSKDDLAARPGHVAWPSCIPEAGELGPFRAEFAIAPVAVGEDDPPAVWSKLERLAEEFHAPLAGLMMRHAVEPPTTVTGPTLVGEGLAFKALKPAENGEAVVLRCVNLTERRTRGMWRWPVRARRAVRARLDETPLESLELSEDGTELFFEAAPREVVTLLVWP
jgi:alpha-mannosidase